MDCSVLAVPEADTPTPTPGRLPNELLLCVFLHVSKERPHTFPRLYSVCRQWLSVIKRYECLLWRIATTTAFPGTSIPQRQSDIYGRGYQDKAHEDWKRMFFIHDGWVRQKAQMFMMRLPMPRGFVQKVPRVDFPQYMVHQQHMDHSRDHDNNIAQGFVHVPDEQQGQERTTAAVAMTEWDDVLIGQIGSYEGIYLIPQAHVCIKTYRSNPLMKVLEWPYFEDSIDIEDHAHEDLISGVAVNVQGTLLVSSSIDGTARIWDIQQNWCQADSSSLSFESKVQRYGCPIQYRNLLMGHTGWVTAVAIENTTVVTGGNDNSIRVWDALTGTLLQVLPDIFTPPPDAEGHCGVSTVALQGSLIGSGTVFEGYKFHDLDTGTLLMELDEPLTYKEHVRFGWSSEHQFHSPRMAITDTVIITNSKQHQRLCVWNRQTGQFMYRIGVVPERAVDNHSSLNKTVLTTTPMAAHSAHEPGPIPISTPTGISSNDEDGGGDFVFDEILDAVYMFRINKSGSKLICTLGNGSVALFEFGKPSSSPASSVKCSWLSQLPEHNNRFGYPSTWIWTPDRQGNHRITLI